MITWDVLISTIPHRHAPLCQLLAELNRQWQPGLGVRVLRDNLERRGYDSHIKRKWLTESSGAGYICFIDDDDAIAHDYVAAISGALASEPDYVGFMVRITEDGAPRALAIHSLQYGEWSAWPENADEPLRRDITHLNPMRRELALRSDWAGRTDEQWAMWLRRTGHVRTEVMIPRVMYEYRHSRTDNFASYGVPGEHRGHIPPMVLPLPEIPSYPWLTVL
jgi:hypothetical protein